MAPDSSPQRTAPIAIAPKMTRPRQGVSACDEPPRCEAEIEMGLCSLGTGASTGSISADDSMPPLCHHCDMADVESVFAEEEDGGYLSTQNHESDASLSKSPQSRKRKMGQQSAVAANESLCGQECPTSTSSRRRLQRSSISSSTAASSSLLEDMANFCGPICLGRSLGLQKERYSEHIGPTTDFEPSLINLSIFDIQDESLLSRESVSLRKVSDEETFLMLPDHATAGFDRIVQDLDAIEAHVAPHGGKLIDIYFRIVHPSFPIVQKHVFLEKYERSHHEFSPPVLAAVYILAINWWEHSEELSRLPRPQVVELEKLMRQTLDDAMSRPKLSTIQAGLLLSQKPGGDQWVSTAQLVAVGQELGLHLDCSDWNIPPWEKSLRRRLAWGLYMQDKWSALIHGRPSHIMSSNWDVRALSVNDFPDVDWDEDEADERQDIEIGRLLFSRAVQLSMILAEILDNFYTLQSTKTISDAGSQGPHLVLAMAKPVQVKLEQWYGSLPADLRLESHSVNAPSLSGSSRLSSTGYLHLAYFATEMTLHRRIIRCLASNPDSVDAYVQHVCRSAAKARLISAMDFVNRLAPSHLRSFWYFASKANFALIGTFGSLLWATSPGREEAEWYRRRLGEYRWTLSVNSKPGESKGLTEFAMRMLDLSTGLLKQLPEKPSMSGSDSQVEVPGSPASRATPAGHKVPRAPSTAAKRK